MPELTIPPDVSKTSVAVLVSGGVESATLAGLLPDHFASVYPVYIRFGLVWESAEESHLRRFLSGIQNPRLRELKTIELPVSDVYDRHWSVSGQGIPDHETEDEAVYLPGRNLLLIAKTAIWCRLNDIRTIALGHLGSNPFPDASADFFNDCEKVIERALGTSIRIVRPVSDMKKIDVILMGSHLPLELSFSCINPVDTSGGGYLHCGCCNKCAERMEAFEKAGLQDLTTYAPRINSSATTAH